ncbi:hypothetical protein DL98DRAFT_534945 [Cadophora sp. DSE1049]|nr:hypothetical protein DL98DRAFT_534945 [Cadophora sp. DSE1049]
MSNSREAKLRQTCDACQAIKIRCSRGKPTCARCLAQKIPCHYSLSRRIGRPRRLAVPNSPPPCPTIARWSDDHETVTPQQPQPSIEIGDGSETPNQYHDIDWSAEDDDIITDETETLSSSSNDSIEGVGIPQDNLVNRRAPVANMTDASSVQAIAISDQDLLDSIFGSPDFSRLPNTNLSPPSIDIEVSSTNPPTQRELDYCTSNPIHNNFTQHLEPIHPFTFSSPLTQRSLSTTTTTTLPLGWELSQENTAANNEISPRGSSLREPTIPQNSCRCFEAALSVTLSIGSEQLQASPGSMDLALDIEAQLRESVPLAVQCIACKGRRGEILKLFSNAMSDTVDLLQVLCEREFSAGSVRGNDYGSIIGIGDQGRRTQAEEGGLDEWMVFNLGHTGGRGNPAQEREKSTFNSHSTMFTGTKSRQAENKTSSVSTSRCSFEHLPISAPSQPNTRQETPMSTHTSQSDLRLLLGSHLIVGSDKKFVLMHLLRRRLCAFADALETLIRAMQDLHTALRRVNSSTSTYGNRNGNESDALAKDGAPNAVTAEVVMRKSMKTAAKLYDIIDHLEMVSV